MWKFLGGVLLGVIVALGYVRFDLPLPEFLQLPGMLKGNIVSSATEQELYDLSADGGTRLRALDVYFANQSRAAAELDAASGHPFLHALHRERARHEARLLLAAREGFAAALAQPALRQTLERKHGVSDDAALEAAMLADRLDDYPFLTGWLAKSTECPGVDPVARLRSCAGP